MLNLHKYLFWDTRKDYLLVCRCRIEWGLQDLWGFVVVCINGPRTWTILRGSQSGAAHNEALETSPLKRVLSLHTQHECRAMPVPHCQLNALQPRGDCQVDTLQQHSISCCW